MCSEYISSDVLLSKLPYKVGDTVTNAAYLRQKGRYYKIGSHFIITSIKILDYSISVKILDQPILKADSDIKILFTMKCTDNNDTVSAEIREVRAGALNEDDALKIGKRLENRELLLFIIPFFIMCVIIVAVASTAAKESLFLIIPIIFVITFIFLPVFAFIFKVISKIELKESLLSANAE